MRMKKFLTFLLTLAMVVSMLPATAFAANNTATTMRLAKTQGTVAVTNATGKKVTQTANMKLYNGYKMKTGAKSYAWISLDDTKVAKLDANSVMEVQKKGKSLTLYLSSGNMFFNVKDPLKSGETFSIKTSTMTTGIRGTSGCVRVINDRVTEVHLLTGQVEIYTENPALHISKTAVLKAGQKATSLIADEAMAATGEQADIIIEKLLPEEVCGNCSTEIAADPALAERIKAEAPHLLPDKIAAEAGERLAADEKAAEEKQAAIDEKVAQQVFPEDVDPYFEEEQSSGGGGGGGSSAVTPSSIVEVATWGELVQAVSDYNDGIGTTEIRLTADIAAGANDDGLEPIGNQGPLTLNLGTNELKLNGTLVNEGNLTITNTAGYLALLDTVIGQDTTPVVVQNTGHLILQNGTIVLNEDIGVENSGIFDMTGGAIRGGTVTTTGGTSTFTPAMMPNDVGVYNYGTVNISSGMIEAATGIEDQMQAGDTYNVTISGGTVKGISSPNSTGGALRLTGSAKISGGTISGGITVPAGAVLDMTAGDMTAGTVTAAGSERGISVSGGTVNLTGGAITADAGLGANAAPVGLNVESGTVILNGTDITANAGTAVSLKGGTTTFQSGTITAETDATAVQTASNTIYNTAIKATIRAKAENAVFVQPNGGLPAGYQTALINNYYVLTETGGIVTWEQFVMAVEEFNAGAQAQTIRLGAAIIPPATGAATLPAIGATSTATGTKNPSLLTIDLNNYALTLPQTMFNEGNLLITGGTVSADYTTVSTLIQNSGTLELANARMNLSMNQTGIANAAGTVNMTSGTIQLNSVPSYGIVSDNGEVNLNGGEIILVGCGSSSVNYGIQGINAAITIDGGTVREGDGIVNTTANNNILIAVSGDSSLNLESGTITAHYGTAISVPAVEMLELGSAEVTGKDAEKLLVTANGVETGYTSSTSDDGYYKLEKYQTVATWAAFVNEIADFNDKREAKMIQLTKNINPTPEEFAAAATLEAIGNATADTLTIDLGGYTLGLPQTLTTDGSDLIITGTPNGSLTTGQEWTASGSTTLIENNDELIVQGGTMNVPDGVTGIYNKGTFTLRSENGGSIDVTGGVGVENRGTVNLEMGTITVDSTETSGGVGIANGGQLNMSAPAMISVVEGVGVDDIGSEGKNTFTMNGGEIWIKGTTEGIGLQFGDMVVALNGGEIDAYGSLAVAVVAMGSSITMDSDMVVKAVVQNNVYQIPEDNGGVLPNGFVVSANTYMDGLGNYYYQLESEVADAGIDTWAEFEEAVTAFNAGTGASTITLAADINPAANEVSAAVQERGTLNIGNGTVNGLTIDLAGRTLALPVPLSTMTSSPLEITGDTTGTITTGQAWDMNNSTYLINNYTKLTLEGGTIDVPHGAVGVNNSGTFNMDGGSMNVAYTTGIQNSGTVNLNAGTITMPAAGAPEGVTEETSIAYSAYMTSATGAVLNLKGTSITMADGISYVYTDANGDDVVSPAVAVNNEAGNTVTMTAGTIKVNSDLGISNKGTLNISGGTINVNADNGENVKGIENFGTFNQTGGIINVNGYAVGVYTGGGTAEAGAGTTVNVKSVNAVGIENAAALTLSGATIDARSGNVGGTGVSNTGTLKMTAGTIWTDLMPGVSMSAGTFNMTGGSFQSGTTGYGAVDLDGGTATLSGGSIAVTGSNAKERGVQVSGGATLIIDGTAITATGYTTYNENNKTIAIYHQSGTVRIDSGTITATPKAFDANTGIGNAYALYSETSNWAGLDVAPGVGVVVRASTAANVINPAHTSYEVSTTATDGYYTLVVPE